MKVSGSAMAGGSFGEVGNSGLKLRIEIQSGGYSTSLRCQIRKQGGGQRCVCATAMDELDPSLSMAVIGALRRGRGLVKGQGIYSMMMRCRGPAFIGGDEEKGCVAEC